MPARCPPCIARATLGAAVLTAAAACSPALDWREARLDGGRLAALFPCRPVEASREATLLDRRLRMSLHACRADGSTFAVTHTDVGDAALVAPALAQMRAALATNLGAAPAEPSPFRVESMTTDVGEGRLRLRGTLPDGARIDEEAVFFARGTRIYQVAVLGNHARGEAAETFFASLRLPP